MRLLHYAAVAVLLFASATIAQTPDLAQRQAELGHAVAQVADAAQVANACRLGRQQGAGGVHHVAFRTIDANYDAWAERLNEFRIPNSGKVDRFWFRSLSSAMNISARLVPEAGGDLISRYCSPRLA